MLPSSIRRALLLPALSSTFAAAQTCKSFGVDFQDGQTYFQDSLSSDPFTFVSQYTGCQPDTCFNIFVDTKGDQVQCSDTSLTPDNTPRLSTCPTLKKQLLSGAYSVIMISNNAAGDSIAYQRDFNLTVGPQQTVTATPTVVVPVTSTPVVNSTSTFIDVVSNLTLAASTVYAPSTTIVNTKTIVPSPVTVTTTKTLFTIDKVTPVVSVYKSTKYVTPSCTVPPRQATGDRLCRIKPTVGGNQQAYILSIATQAVPALATATGKTSSSSRFKNKVRVNGRSVEFDKREFVRERAARMAAVGAQIVKRAPDEPTVTVTDTNTADYPTVTSTIFAPTSTAITVSTLLTTATITPAPITVLSGRATAPVVTVTAATPTKAVTKYTVFYNTVRKTLSLTVTITSTTTPAAVASACKSSGGHFLLS